MPLVATILQLDFMIHKESRLISDEVGRLYLSAGHPRAGMLYWFYHSKKESSA